MPSRVLAVLLLTAVLLSLISPALANSWGLTGPLYAAVSFDRAWKDYTTIAPQQGDLALLGSRDHNALFYIDPAGLLEVCHTAVWQPQDAVRPSLQGIENGFILSAGEETFTFRLMDGQYLLSKPAFPVSPFPPCLMTTLPTISSAIGTTTVPAVPSTAPRRYPRRISTCASFPAPSMKH